MTQRGKPKVLPVLAFVLWVVLWALPAFAQQPVAELVLERGRVKIQRGEQIILVTDEGVPVPLHPGDLLHSGGETRARLIFLINEDRVSLYANTLFRLEEVKPERSVFGLNIGKALFGVFSRFVEGRFKVVTPSATIGVKGTEFVAATDGRETFLLALSGVVGMVNVEFPDQEVLIRANEASTVVPGALPSPPFEVPEDTREKIVTEDSLEDLEELPFESSPSEGEGASTEEEAQGEEQETAEADESEKLPGSETVVDVMGPVQEEIETNTEEIRPSEDVGTKGVPVKIRLAR